MSASADSPYVLHPDTASPGPLAERPRARVVGAGDHEEAADTVGERVERLRVGLDRAVVVQVVGLDVGDDRDLGVVGEEGAVALVRFGDEDVARAVVGVGPGLVEIAADGERRVGAAVLQCDGEHRGRRRLAVGAGDGDRAPLGHDRRQGSRPRAGPATGARRASTTSGFVLADGRGHHDGVGAAEWSAAWPTWTVAPSARRPTRTLESLASLPETGTPRASMIRAIPLMPAPPIPTKCTLPSSSAGSTRSGGATITTYLH